MFSGEREREQGEKRRARESESGAGQLRGFVRGIEGVQGKQEVASRGGRWRSRVPASVGHTPSSFCPRRKTTGKARVGWAGQGGELGRLVGCTGEAR